MGLLTARAALVLVVASAALVACGSTFAQGRGRPDAISPFPTGLSGVLAFQSDVAGRPAIYTLDLATGAVVRLSGDPAWSETNPRWSPDGRRLVFASNRAHYEGAAPERGTPDMDLWIVNADGTGRSRLTTDPATESDPAWAADGRSVVYTSDRDSRGDLYRLVIDTGAVTRLTHHYVGRAIMPAPAPSGPRVAFAAQTLRVGAFWDFQVHVLDTATGATGAVASTAGACWPTWSRDGTRLANVRLARDETSSLEVRAGTAGTATRLPTPRDLWSYYPEWSPDDSRLAFAVSPAHHEGENWDLAVIDVASGGWTRLTRGPGNDRLPDWKK